MLQHTEISSEVRLWRSVLKRAILDCCGIFEDSKFNNRLATRHRIIYEAESWFNHQDDYEQVCSFANMQTRNVFELKENAKKYFKNSSRLLYQLSASKIILCLLRL